MCQKPCEHLFNHIDITITEIKCLLCNKVFEKSLETCFYLLWQAQRLMENQQAMIDDLRASVRNLERPWRDYD